MANFKLKFLWLEKSIAFALDEKIGERVNPITEYFFWPRTDAWEELKLELEKKTWISSNESIEILNQTTEIINYWEEKNENKNIQLKEIEKKFPNCIFIGHN
uniref:Small ribosomal subunit protein cS23 n=1 Tax=Eutreptia sp. CCAC 1914B TaxID=2979827 RepID=A0A977PJR6_9EUGL|nr:putative ribosomal protein PSRP-3/Ycf65 [Eutreptia sp. CCAC 1914B]